MIDPLEAGALGFGNQLTAFYPFDFEDLVLSDARHPAVKDEQLPFGKAARVFLLRNREV